MNYNKFSASVFWYQTHTLTVNFNTCSNIKKLKTLNVKHTRLKDKYKDSLI